MRDAISLLDQCSACAEEITAETVSMAAGIAGKDHLFSLLEAIADSDAPTALSITGTLYDMSKDLTRLCEELISQLRNIMLLKASPETAENLIICLPDELERLKALAEKSDLDTVMNRLTALQECRERMQRAMNKRVEFEMALIMLCGKKAKISEGIDNSEIYDKIKQLENKISSVSAGTAQSAAKREEPEVLTANSPVSEPEVTPNIDIKKLKSEDLIPCTRWDEILEKLKVINPAVAGSLDGSSAATAGNYMFILSKNRFFLTLFRVKENAISLGEAVFDVLGERFIIRAKCTTTVNQQKSMAEKLIKKAIDSNIETAVDNNQ